MPRRVRSDEEFVVANVTEHLVGATLAEAYVERLGVEGDDFGLPVLVFITRDKKRSIHVIVQRDPEGNGPGWLDLVDVEGKRLRPKGG